MYGLIGKLSTLDASAESAVRVIAAFDALMERRVTATALTRAAASLAGCNAGMRLIDRTILRFADDGKELEAVDPSSDLRASIDSGQQVWLERSGSALSFDDLILERFALTARVLLDPPRSFATAEFADPALIELLVSDRVEVEDRARAIRLLGLASDEVRVVAVAVDDSRDAVTEAVALIARDPNPVRALRVANIDGVAALVLEQRRNSLDRLGYDLKQQLADRTIDTNGGYSIRVGIGDSVPAQRARESWTHAQIALKFTLTDANETAVVEYGELGARVLLADVPACQRRMKSDR